MKEEQGHKESTESWRIDKKLPKAHQALLLIICLELVQRVNKGKESKDKRIKDNQAQIEDINVML